MSKKLSISKAIGEALHEEMARDENVIIMGEDMGKMGNVFGITVGFQEEFGENRVFDTPISESGFCGMAVGAAMRGIRPVVELMYDDFITVAADPIINQAAKMRYMTGGQATVPMVLRLPMGAGRRNAGQHSQCFENIFCHTPGLKVVAPSSAEDAKGLLKSAIRDEDPVIFIEHKLLYAKKEQIPEGEYTIPLGVADVKREGTDITIVTWSREVYFALEAAEELAKEGISAEVVNICTIKPLDEEIIINSAKKTGKVVTVEEHSVIGGLGSAVCDCLCAHYPVPVKKVGMQDVFGESGSAAALVEKYGLDAKGVYKSVKASLHPARNLRRYRWLRW